MQNLDATWLSTHVQVMSVPAKNFLSCEIRGKISGAEFELRSGHVQDDGRRLTASTLPHLQGCSSFALESNFFDSLLDLPLLRFDLRSKCTVNRCGASRTGRLSGQPGFKILRTGSRIRSRSIIAEFRRILVVDACPDHVRTG